MKHWMISAALICFGSIASATPYFRPFDYRHPQFVAGALVDPRAPGNTSGGSLLPLITHSPKDGCLLPSIVCEDWSPLAVGASMHSGDVTLDVGPVGNVLPWMVAALQAAMPSGYDSPLAFLKNEGQAVTFSAGPMWEYQQRTDKGYFRIFTGLALRF